jgi:hypothetical protein
MSMRSAFLLGLFLLAAALLHGGIYSAGHDFVMNRFTGWYEFVPADEDEEGTSIRMPSTTRRCLDLSGTRG